MLAVGDALAMAVQSARGFSADQFYLFHPAGALGRKLRRVEVRSGWLLRRLGRPKILLRRRIGRLREAERIRRVPMSSFIDHPSTVGEW